MKRKKEKPRKLTEEELKTVRFEAKLPHFYVQRVIRRMERYIKKHPELKFVYSCEDEK